MGLDALFSPQLYEWAAGLTAAAGLGSLVGLEREVHGQPAGLRTHMILAVGAALAAILSVAYSQFLSSPELPSDPGRIVAQVVSGVGFLGAGAILRFGVTVKGLTTASSLWTTAIIGIACGSLYIELAALTAVIVLIILTGISKVEKIFLPSYKTHTLKVVLDDQPGIIRDVKALLAEKKVNVVSLNVGMPDKETLKLAMVIRKPADLGMDSIINLLNGLDETKSMEIE